MTENEVLNFEKSRFVFDQMVEEVHFWKVVRDADGKIKTWRLVFANKSALATWQRSSLEEIANKTTDEIFGDGASMHYMPIVEKIMDEDQTYTYQDYFPNINRHFRFTSIPLGEYFITTGWDISEFVEDNQSLSDDNELLKKQIRLKSEIEKQVQERTSELRDANNHLVENIKELRSLMSSKEAKTNQHLLKISELLLSQSDLLNVNSRVLKQISGLDEENKRLREKLLQGM